MAVRSSLAAAALTAAAFATALPGRALAVEVPPEITHTPITEAKRCEPVSVRATIVSPAGRSILDPAILVKSSGSLEFVRVPLRQDKDHKDIHTGTIPGRMLNGDTEYFLEAIDVDGTKTGRAGSREAPFRIKVPSPPPPAEVGEACPVKADAVAGEAVEVKEMGGLRKVGIATDVIGGATLILAIVLDNLAAGDHDRGANLAKTGLDSDRVAFNQAMSDFHKKRVGATVCYVVGAIFVAGGLGMTFWPEDKAVTVSAAPTEGGALLTMHGRW
jgi:hypothetical protein